MLLTILTQITHDGKQCKEQKPEIGLAPYGVAELSGSPLTFATTAILHLSWSDCMHTKGIPWGRSMLGRAWRCHVSYCVLVPHSQLLPDFPDMLESELISMYTNESPNCKNLNTLRWTLGLYILDVSITNIQKTLKLSIFYREIISHFSIRALLLLNILLL